jgi:hypothetical protein
LPYLISTAITLHAYRHAEFIVVCRTLQLRENKQMVIQLNGLNGVANFI